MATLSNGALCAEADANATKENFAEHISIRERIHHVVRYYYPPTN